MEWKKSKLLFPSLTPVLHTQLSKIKTVFGSEGFLKNKEDRRGFNDIREKYILRD